MVHEMPDLWVLSHVRLHGGIIAQRKLVGECLKPFEAPLSQHQFGPVLSKMTGSSFSQSAACSGDDDHFVLDSFCHSVSFPDGSSRRRSVFASPMLTNTW